MQGEEFARAARTYGDSVYRVALHALKNPADAEDVMQTVLLRLFEREKPFESGPAAEDPEKAELLRAVMGLEEKYRLAIYLYYYEGLSVTETAAALRAKQSTVQSWLLRARAKLRKELTGEPETAEKKEGVTYVPSQIP